jgi:hypothetical protein
LTSLSQIVNHPEFAEKVPEWMATSKQVATGNRRRVLENGDDNMNSDDEDNPNMKPDEESGMYTPEMDPLKGPIRLTQSQAAAQKAAAQALKALKSPPRSQSPMPTGSSDDNDPESSQYIWSASKGIFRKNKHWAGSKVSNRPAIPAPDPQKALPAPAPLKALPAPEPRHPTPVSSDTEDHDEMMEDQKRLARVGKKKAAASQRAPAGFPTQEAKASHPMQTRRREASRAGGLRPGGGLGQMDTRVDLFDPSKT